MISYCDICLFWTNCIALPLERELFLANTGLDHHIPFKISFLPIVPGRKNYIFRVNFLVGKFVYNEKKYFYNKFKIVKLGFKAKKYL